MAAGVQLKALSAFLDEDNDLQICGEANFSKAPRDDHSVEIVALLYDDQGHVIKKNEVYVGSKGLTFDAFDINIYGIKRTIDRIKIFVKKG